MSCLLVGAAECAVADYDVFHASGVVATYDESSVCVVDGAVVDHYVLARAVVDTFLSDARLHAESVVTGVDDGVGDEALAAVAEVDGVAVLCVPWASDCYVVDDDVVATYWMEVESW